MEQKSEACEPNRVQLSGWAEDRLAFSHTLFGENFYTFHLCVPRLSGAKDILPVTVGERALDAFPEPGAELVVMGQLRSYNRETPEGNRLLVTVFARRLFPRAPEEPYHNEIALTGYVCKPPVYRTTPFDREIADLLIAVNRAYRKSDYLPVIAWGRNARFAGGLSVGDCISVEGRIQSREYQKLRPDGSAIVRTAYEVSAGRICKA